MKVKSKLGRGIFATVCLAALFFWQAATAQGLTLQLRIKY